jgi:hypothetical protein
MKLQVEGNPNLYRDMNSGALVNGSDNEFQKYLELKEMKLKGDVNEIKSLMKMILQKLDTNS